MHYFNKSLCCLNVLFIGLTIVSSPAKAQASLLRYGESVQGYIAQPDDLFVWSFAGQAGDRIFIDMLADPNDRLTPYLQLLSPDNRILAEDDSHLRLSNAHIGPLVLPQAGMYQIAASSVSGIGHFTLLLTSTESMTHIALDKPLQIAFSQAHPLVYWRYDSPSTQPLRLEARPLSPTPSPPPYFQLLTLEGNSVLTAAYQSDGVDPFIPATEVSYIIMVQLPFPPADQAYRYEVSLSPSEVVLLHSGERVEGEISPNAIAVHYFEAEAGQNINLELTLLKGGISPAVYIRPTSGEPPLFTNTGSQVRALSVTITIPATGLYAIELSDGSYSGAVGQYALTFEVLP